MIEVSVDAERISEFYGYISENSVRAAFALLYGSFACFNEVSCRVSPQKKVRSVAVDLGGKWCFSVMPSRKKLVFQWRPPVIKMKLYRKSVLQKTFGERFTDKLHKPDDEHWAVTVRTLDEALFLLAVLDLK